MGRLLRRRSTDATSILEEGGAHLARHRLRNVDEPIALLWSDRVHSADRGLLVVVVAFLRGQSEQQPGQ